MRRASVHPAPIDPTRAFDYSSTPSGKGWGWSEGEGGTVRRKKGALEFDREAAAQSRSNGRRQSRTLDKGVARGWHRVVDV